MTEISSRSNIDAPAITWRIEDRSQVITVPPIRRLVNTEVFRACG